MNDVNTLYKVRQREEVLEKMNYNKFIFNGHF